MKIISGANEIGAVFQFEHAGATISVTTLTRFPEVVVFYGEGKNAGPFRTIEAAMRWAEHLNWPECGH